MNENSNDVMFIIADISGYTHFTTGQSDCGHHLLHSQIIIAELLEKIVDSIKHPLIISKLEGDAIFLYAQKRGDETEWENAKKMAREFVLNIIPIFRNELKALAKIHECECESCRNLDKLKLKVVAHFGTALFYPIGKFIELLGMDVILVHRLLKNTVKSDQYILLTKPALLELELNTHLHKEYGAPVESEEIDKDIGSIKTFVFSQS